MAIRRTQRGPGLKLASKYFGPYEIMKVLRNHRYILRKIGEHEGPSQTSSAADFIKPWVSDEDYDEEIPEIIEGGCRKYPGRILVQDGRM